MNAVQIFIALALALTVVVVGVLWRALWRASTPAVGGHERENVLSHVAVYREQVADLERELAQGSLDQAGFDLSHEELTQRLLEDAPPPTPTVTNTPARPKWLMGSLALAVPLIAFSMYFVVGTPMALDPNLAANHKAMSKSHPSVWLPWPSNSASGLKRNPTMPKAG